MAGVEGDDVDWELIREISREHRIDLGTAMQIVSRVLAKIAA